MTIEISAVGAAAAKEVPAGWTIQWVDGEAFTAVRKDGFGWSFWGGGYQAEAWSPEGVVYQYTTHGGTLPETCPEWAARVIKALSGE